MRPSQTLDSLVRERLKQWPQRPPGVKAAALGRDAWLRGRPIDAARVAAQAQTPTQAGAIGNTPIAVRPPAKPATGFPHASKRVDTATIPAVVATYLERWLADRADVSTRAGVISHPRNQFPLPGPRRRPERRPRASGSTA